MFHKNLRGERSRRARTDAAAPHWSTVRGEGRWGPPERFVEQNLSWRIGDVILATNDVRNSHQRVVDHHGIVVGGNALRPQEHRIAEHVGLETHFASHQVIEHHLPTVRNAETNRRWLPGLHSATHVLGHEIAAAAHIPGRTALAQGVTLADAPFWSPAQASFLREELAEDADWAEVVDELNLRLRGA